MKLRRPPLLPLIPALISALLWASLTQAGPMPNRTQGPSLNDRAIRVQAADPAPKFGIIPQAATPPDKIAMAVNLAPVWDISVQQPFLDVMKTARTWIGHRPREWGGVSYDDLKAAGFLDPQGWPVDIPRELGSIGTLILTDLPKEATTLAGRYRLSFEGNGIVEVSGRAASVRYGKNRVEFDFTPGPGSVDIRIQRTDRARRGDYVRNITVVKLDNIAAHAAGEVFNPLWLNHLRGFKAVRFMDWMGTNNSTQSQWADRPTPDEFAYTRAGVPVEIMLDLADRIGADPWFTIPHMADDEYAEQFAATLRDGLAPDRKAYVEYSNEVWNWQFQQAAWADEQALARWGQENAWMEYYGLRAAEIARIFTRVFGADAQARLVNVISSQTGWMGLEQAVLTAPNWLAENPANPNPAEAFDAYAITGYFGGAVGAEENAAELHDWLADSQTQAEAAARELGLAGAQASAYVTAHRYDAATALLARDVTDGSVTGRRDGSMTQLTQDVFPYHAQIARTYGLDLIMYEGGTHIVGQGPVLDDPNLTAFLVHFNYTPEMAALYQTLMMGWDRAGGQLFNVYADVMHPSKWGSWGALRHLSDSNPRWDMLMRFR